MNLQTKEVFLSVSALVLYYISTNKCQSRVLTSDYPVNLMEWISCVEEFLQLSVTPNYVLSQWCIQFSNIQLFKTSTYNTIRHKMLFFNRVLLRYLICHGRDFISYSRRFSQIYMQYSYKNKYCFFNKRLAYFKIEFQTEF